MGSVEFSVSALPNCKTTLWKGQPCLWLRTLTETGEPFHLNNHLPLTACFSPRSSKYHPCRRSRTSLSRCLKYIVREPIWQVSKQGPGRVKWLLDQYEMTVAKGKTTLQSSDIRVIFVRAHCWTNQRNTVSSNTARVSKVHMMERLRIFLYSLRAALKIPRHEKAGILLRVHRYYHHCHHRHHHHHRHRYHQPSPPSSFSSSTLFRLLRSQPPYWLTFMLVPHLILAKTSFHWYN